MLAKKYEEKMNIDGYYVSEKLDGVRSVFKDGIFYSRNNNVIQAPQWFIDQMPDAVLDGELFTKRNDFPGIMSIVSKDVPVDSEWKKIKYMVFDMPLESGDFTARYASLKKIVAKSKNPHLKLVEHKIVKNRQEMEAVYDSLVAQGAEGVMLRKPDSNYETKRSNVLLKVKKFIDDEAEVVGYEYGKGKYSTVMGYLKVKWYKKFGNVGFRIGSGFTDEQRKNYKKLFPIGTIVKVKYFELSKDNRPRFPIFLGVRDKIDV